MFWIYLVLGLIVSTSGSSQSWQDCRLTTYHKCFEGRPTKSGEVFRHAGLTAACRSLPLGSKVTLRYRQPSGRWAEVDVVVNDRGRLPLHRDSNYQFDVTREAATRLGLYRRGPDYRSASWRLVDKRKEFWRGIKR